MAQLDTQILPLLPLTSGVVLPGMVVTLTIESDEAQRGHRGLRVLRRRALARASDRLELREDRHRRQGRGRGAAPQRARGPRDPRPASARSSAPASPGPARPRGCSSSHVPTPSISSERARELSREYKAVLENIVEARGVPEVADFLRGLSDPGQVADTAGYSPDLSIEQKVEVLETLDVEQRLEKVLDWAKEVLAELELKDKIRTDVRDGMEKNQREYILRQQMDAIRKELGDESDEEIVEEYRKKIADASMPEGARKEAERELGRLERDVRAVARVRLDPHVPRLDDRDPVGRPHRGQPRHRRGARDPRRGPRRPVRREGPDRRVPRRPQAASGARARTVVRPRLGRDPHAGRTPGRRQDVARRVRGARARTQVRPGLARRDPRRGRDPRAPAHLRRRAAGPHRACPEGGRHEEPGDDARRGRQGRRRLARRPLERAARGARPRPEPHVPRPLPRGRPRPVRGAVHRDRQRGRDDPGPAARPDGGHPARRLHRGREGRDRARPPARTAGGAQRPAFGRGRDDRRRGPCRSSATTPGRPACGTSSASSARCCARWPLGSRAVRRSPPFGSTSTTSASTSGDRGSSSRPPSAPASPASRPGSRSPAPAATSCSSRPRDWTATGRTR